jgi:DNA-binding transcriptional ArsR family regulator
MAKTFNTKKSARVRNDLIRLHARGLDDQQIAAELGVSDSTVRYHRKRLGLAHNVTARRRRELHDSASRRKRLEKCACAEKRGWPYGPLCPTRLLVLEALSMKGGATARELMRLCGLTYCQVQMAVWRLRQGRLVTADRTTQERGHHTRYSLLVRKVPCNEGEGDG